MRQFALTGHTPAVAELRTPERLMPLGAGSPNLSVHDRLKSLSHAKLAAAPVRIVDRDQAETCCAGLWLLHDFLDEAHKIVQAIEWPEASYWHAIVHRREGDYSNAKYWNRQAGELPIFAELAKHVRESDSPELTSVCRQLVDATGNWQPDGWVDAYRDACRSRPPYDDPAVTQCVRDLQQVEWRLLMTHCWHRAIGSDSGG